MVDISDMLGDYLSVDYVRELPADKRIAVIVEVGDKIKGQYGKEIELKVEVNGVKKKTTLIEGTTTIKAIAKAWGMNTSDYVGRQARLSIEKSKNDKEFVMLTPKAEEVVKLLKL
jgi:hypothetical protein